MTRRKKIKSKPMPADWDIHTGFKIPGKAELRPGSEFTVRGLGRLRFRHYVVSPSGEWVDGFDKEQRIRSVSPAKVRTVHRKEKMR